MPVSANLLEAMMKAGATAEMIVAVVRAAEEEDMAKLTEKRAKDAERKRRSRAAAQEEMSAMSRGHDVTSRDAADPLPKQKRKVSPCTPSKEKTQPLPIPPIPSDEGMAPPLAAAPKSDPRGSRLPEAWEPSSEALAWASENISGISVAAETEKFRDYFRAKAGQDGRKLDWTGTWRNWMRKAAEYAARASPGRAGQPPKESIVAKIYAERASNAGS